MIEIVNGNLMNAKENIIGQQVNCQGVMGAGVAKQIKSKYYAAYDAYNELVEHVMPKYLLGRCQIVDIDGNRKIANLFGQLDYGRVGMVYTDYDALRNSLTELCWYAEENNLSVALPYNIGCGLANGDWDIVSEIIEDVFSDYEVTLYKLE